MKTKYFRFLFCGNKSCLVHFGELTDTCTEERFTFLYLYGSKKREAGRDSGEVLFLYPKHIDLVVVGNANEQTDDGLEEIFSKTQVSRVILPECGYSWKAKLDRAAEIKYLPSKTENNILGDNQSKTVRNAEEIRAAGWRFFMKSYAPGSITMFHGLDREGMGQEVRHGSVQEELFEDCLMSVKILDRGKRCAREENPDGFGCAMGCTLKQDCDVCKYQRTGKNGGYLTGALLCGSECREADLEEMKRDLGDQLAHMRFFAVPGMESTELPQRQEGRFKRYYIGLQKETKGAAIEKICKGGLYEIPVLLKNGEGICCSGLLKYSE